MKLVGRKHWRSHVGARWGPTASPPPLVRKFFHCRFLGIESRIIALELIDIGLQ
jgi:hypothetical protein